MPDDRIYSYEPGGACTVMVYDVIGRDFFGDGVSEKQMADAIGAATRNKCTSIDLLINSPGGNVFSALTMLDSLKASGLAINTRVQGLAASAASFLAMAGDKITMAKGSRLMVHRASALVVGNAQAHLDMAAVLETTDASLAAIYAERSGKSADEMLALMTAETWMTPSEAISNGLADSEDDAPVAEVVEMTAELPESWRSIAATWQGMDLEHVAQYARRSAQLVASAAPQRPANPKEKESTMPEITSMTPDQIVAAAPCLQAHIDQLTATAVGAAVKAERERCGAIVNEANAIGLTDKGMELLNSGASSDAALAALRADKLAAITAAAPQGPGANTDDPNTGGDAKTRWDERVKTLVAEGKTQPQAIAHLARTEPELHKAFIAAVNRKQ